MDDDEYPHPFSVQHDGDMVLLDDDSVETPEHLGITITSARNRVNGVPNAVPFKDSDKLMNPQADSQVSSGSNRGAQALGLSADLTMSSVMQIKKAVQHADGAHFTSLYQAQQTLIHLRSTGLACDREQYAEVGGMIQQRILALQQDLADDLQDLRIDDIDGKSSEHNPAVLSRASSISDMLRIATFAAKQYGSLPVQVEPLRVRTLVGSVPMHGFFKYKHLLQKPRLRQYWKNANVIVREDQEHRASWNELFFDLIFAVILSKLGHDLERDMSLPGLGEFVVLFAIVWRLWSVANTHVNRFNPSDAFHKLYTFFEMLFAMGIAVHQVRGVVVAYLAARFLTEMLAIWACVFESKVRHATVAEFLVFLLSTIPWFVSLSLEPNGIRPSVPQYLLWSFALSIELFGQLIIGRFIKRARIPINIEHTTERLGLFTIITMGEQLVALLFDDEVSTGWTYGMAILGGMLVFSFQIEYFDVEANRSAPHALAMGGWRSHLWYMTHLPMQCAIVAAATVKSAGLSATQILSPHHATNFEQWLLSGSIGTIWLCIWLIGKSHGKDVSPTLVPTKIRFAMRLGIAIICACVPVVNVVIQGDNLQAPLSNNIITVILVCLSTVVSIVDLHGSTPRPEAAKGVLEDEQPIIFTERVADHSTAKTAMDCAVGPGIHQAVRAAVVRTMTRQHSLDNFSDQQTSKQANKQANK